MKHTILCVDDEIDNVDSLERLFRGKYTVLKATSGNAALEILDKHPDEISVIITDQRMPGLSGVELLEESIKSHPNTIRILLTGYTDIESIIVAINEGQIYRYLNKPWDPVDLQSTVKSAIEKYELDLQLKEKNKELEKALNELKTLDEAKNHFMVLINHELKTPLTSIISFNSLLKETKLNEEQEVCVKRIEKSSDRLKRLIDDSLLVVQGETKTLKLNITSFDCSQIQIQMNAEVSILANQKGIKTILRWVDKKVIGDQNYIQQVISRIIHNAVKFAKDNTQIIVRAELVDNHTVKFSVFNQGEGISKQVVDKILNPFFLDENVMNHSVGIGLGLTICQSILKAHNSFLKFSNEVDGVEVSFELKCL